MDQLSKKSIKKIILIIKIRLLIRDEGTGIKKYTARINNEWALFEYEQKKNLIQFKPDDFIN